MNRETSYFYKDKLQTLVIWENGSKLGPLQFGGSTVSTANGTCAFTTNLQNETSARVQKFVQVSPTVSVKPARQSKIKIK